MNTSSDGKSISLHLVLSMGCEGGLVFIFLILNINLYSYFVFTFIKWHWLSFLRHIAIFSFLFDCQRTILIILLLSYTDRKMGRVLRLGTAWASSSQGRLVCNGWKRFLFLFHAQVPIKLRLQLGNTRVWKSIWCSSGKGGPERGFYTRATARRLLVP